MMLAVVSTCTPALSAAAGPPALTIGSGHELFLDDRGIEKMEALSRRVVPATKHQTKPVLVADRPWELQGVVAFPSVCYDAKRKVFRMWYLVYNVWWSRHAQAPDGSVPAPARYYQDRKCPNKVGAVPMADSAFICYAESANGVKWTKPELGIHEFQGTKKNNIVLRHGGSHFDSFAVIVRPDWPTPQERYVLIAFVGNWPYNPDQIAKRELKYEVGSGHYAFFSADGIHWKPRWDAPVASLSQAQDRTTWGWDPRRKVFVGNWKWDEKKRRCRRQAESKDLSKWTQPRLILFPDKQDARDAEFYGHYVFPYGSQYLGWLEVYRPGSGTIDFQLIGSRDGQNWARVADRGVFVGRGAKGAFDSTMILIPGSPPVQRGNELWVYYEGSALHHNDKGPERASIGLARARVDGFVAVEGKGKEGKLVTKPVVLKGGRLFINAAAAKGRIRVSVVKPDGSALPGFEVDKSLPVTVDSVTAPLSWRGDPALPTGQPLRLVFHVRSARLFSYWCQ